MSALRLKKILLILKKYVKSLKKSKKISMKQRRGIIDICKSLD